jgi:hypothetical protein
MPAGLAFDRQDMGRDFVRLDFIFFAAARTSETDRVIAGGRLLGRGRRQFFWQPISWCQAACPAQGHGTGTGFTFYEFGRWRNFVRSQTVALTTVLADNFNDVDGPG